MTFDISDYDEIQIYITDGWREWYIPKFRLTWVVDEPHITLYWTDTEKGSSGIRRELKLDYQDVSFGYTSPSSAAEIESVLENYIISAFGGSSGTGDVVGPASAVNNNIPAFDGVTGKLLKDSGESVASLKAYADSLVVGLWDDRGSFDASGGNYPSSGGSGTAGAILKGDIWTISVAGTLPTGQAVEVGDVVRALIDTPGNTQANWAITQNNIGYVAENSANKTDTMAGNTASSVKYLSAKGVYDWAVATFQALLVSGTNIKTVNGTTLLGSGDLVARDYWININTLSGTITSGATRYFGSILRTAGATAGESKIYFRQAGTITIADIVFFANTIVGSNENISISVRLNNTTDYPVATVGTAVAERVFTNTSINVPIAVNDYIEMKIVTPAWGTQPTGVLITGHLIFIAS